MAESEEELKSFLIFSNESALFNDYYLLHIPLFLSTQHLLGFYCIPIFILSIFTVYLLYSFLFNQTAFEQLIFIEHLYI